MSDMLPAKQTTGPPEPAGYASYGPMDEQPSATSPVRLRRMLTFLLRFWWIPIVTSILALGGAVAFVLWAPPVYVSTGKMWEADKINPRVSVTYPLERAGEAISAVASRQAIGKLVVTL